MTRIAFATHTALALGLAAAQASAQQFVSDTTSIPQGSPFNDSLTENVDFGDIDNDGDWDAAFADGGDVHQDQNRIWVNQGFAQSGTLGFFLDETAARAPAILDQSRDIEFVDFDGDGDLDVNVSNTAQILNQSNRWWRNQGPASGSIGFYVDETASRWVDLGEPGSSIPASQVLGSGGFVDWSCDSDFADLDNDGDLDLIHSSYGGAFSANVPTRVFLNDGAGFFSEFNPSGFQLAGSTIANGNPALWCQGLQQGNTADGTGAFADIAMSALDIDIGDIDGDLDLDFVHGARQEPPRMFANRFEENGGVLAFRDVTSLAFPPGYSSGSGHYAQELGDFDDDGDLDIYGVNWVGIPNFTDVTLTNGGNGVYCCVTPMGGVNQDENEGDFFDYDNDGDLDVVLANFSGQERLYENTDGLGGYVQDAGATPVDITTSLDADAADVDEDGDYDLFVANAGNTLPTRANAYLRNTLNTVETHPPVLRYLEQAPNRSSSAAPTVVRVHVYDNAAYYTTWYNATRLEVQVDAGPTLVFPMRSSMGQVFRGEIPGNLVGAITYRAVSTDEHGNTGNTPTLAYTATGPGTPFCFGDGTLATDCPCAPPNVVPNPSGLPAHGCANSFSAAGALLAASGTTAPDTLQFTAVIGPSYSAFGFLFKGNAQNAAGIALGDGVRCADGALIRFGGHNAGTNGASPGEWTYPNAVQTLSVSAATAQLPSELAYYQLYYRNAVANFCSTGTTNVSNGIAVPWP